MKTKVLIIKLGYSETFDKEISKISSLGDVLRTTVVLHLFKDDDVAWLTDESATPLLYQNPYIRRILTYDFTMAFQIQNEMFDVVVNFEKIPGICAMADNIKAWKRYGFRFNPFSGSADSYMFAEKAMEILSSNERKQTNLRLWQESLYEMFGVEWKGEEYILGYRPLTVEQYDVGFNYLVGAKWPTKAWNIDNWKVLEKLCKDKGLSVSWQEGADNIYKYVDWINKCKVLVTNDSLGLHIALSLKKKIVVLFGATNENEVYLYDSGSKVVPATDFNCRPCHNPACTYPQECINTIKPETILNTILQISNSRED